MKNKLFLAGMLAMALTFGLVLAGCPTDGGGGGGGGGGNDTYTVTYAGNGSTGGTVPVDSTAYALYDTVTVKGNTGGLVKTGYGFGGWNTHEDGGGTTYAAGTGTFNIYENTTLYAKWILLGSAPDYPIPLTPSDNSQGWADLLAGIRTAGKYVDLNLSGWTGGEEEFDAHPGDNDAGERYIVSLILPGEATSIKAGDFQNSCFKHFTNLVSVQGNNIETIGDYAFSGCTALTTASFPAETSIGEGAFSGCTALTTVSFPAATTIGEGAFSGCTALTTVSFPAATSIGEDAFYGCTALTTASFLAATTIGNGAFYGCTGLTTASFRAATSIGDYVFYGCTGLTEVTLPQAAPTIPEGSSNDGVYSRTVTVKTPADRTGYDEPWQTNFKALFGQNGEVTTVSFQDL
jgi:hypothetical protein